jgi:hypothetical protein
MIDLPLVTILAQALLLLAATLIAAVAAHV